MLFNILDKIESLPPLPKTVDEIEIFRKKENKEVEELTKIIEKDPLCVVTLLKISNSSLFGFSSKIETISRVINLLGMNFAIYVTLKESINNILKTDLNPYGAKCEDFVEISNLSLSLVNLWVSQIDKKLEEEIVLASMLQEIGKFILSEILVKEGLAEEFKKKIESGIEIKEVEKEFLNITTSEVTAQIFRHWKFNKNLISMIECVDDIDSCTCGNRLKSQILDVVKTVCNISNPLSESSIAKGLSKAKKYGFELEYLNNAINIVKDRELLNK